MIDDVVVAFEYPVGEPVFAHVLPNVLDRIELGRFGRQRDERHVFGHIQLSRDVPARLIHEHHGMGAWLHGERDLPEMQLHRLGVAKRQDEADGLAERGADGAEYIRRCGSLILQGERARPALRPATRDLVLLADAGFVLEPQFERFASDGCDFRQEVGNFFLQFATAVSSCA